MWTANSALRILFHLQWYFKARTDSILTFCLIFSPLIDMIIHYFLESFCWDIMLSPVFASIFLRVHLPVRLNSSGSNLSEGQFRGVIWQDFVWVIRLLAFSRDGSSKVGMVCKFVYQMTSLWWMNVHFTIIWGICWWNENNIKGHLVWIAGWILNHTVLTWLMLERIGLTFCLEDLSGAWCYSVSILIFLLVGVLYVFSEIEVPL